MPALWKSQRQKWGKSGKRPIFSAFTFFISEMMPKSAYFFCLSLYFYK